MKSSARIYLTCLVATWAWFSTVPEASSQSTPSTQQITYAQDRKPGVPWSINVIRVPRHAGRFEIHSAHGMGRALGLAMLSEQAASLSGDAVIPLAAINGDFYRRQGAYLGDPRGLQIMDGELISAPTGGASFWIDAAGDPHIGITESRLRVTWADGSSAPIGLNESCHASQIVLYTPALGASTRTRGGCELVLERIGDAKPLRAGRIYRTRVAQVRRTGNAPLTPDTLVLSMGSGVRVASAQIAVGAEVFISTDTSPSLRGVQTAIGGGPILVSGGRAERVRVENVNAYEFCSADQRHPRSAVGWNADYVFFVEVDGRQRRLSVGMTLEELAAYLVKLGCTEAMNLDGGGSATLWYAGQIRNRPCDGHERQIANALIAVERNSKAAAGASANAGLPDSRLSP